MENKEYGYFISYDPFSSMRQTVLGLELKKYMVFVTTEIEDIPSVNKKYNPGDIGLNVFYTFKNGHKSLSIIKDCYKHEELNRYDSVFRLLGQDNNDGKVRYYFRVLKSNKYNQVDFKEELESVSSFIWSNGQMR
jgi:hypothetical protein